MMSRSSGRRLTLGLAAVCLLAAAPARTAGPGIRGFTDDEAAAQREREQTFRAVPNPDNLREYMRAISAEPHHAGSPGSRKVADYVLGAVQVVGAERVDRDSSRR